MFLSKKLFDFLAEKYFLYGLHFDVIHFTELNWFCGTKGKAQVVLEKKL